MATEIKNIRDYPEASFQSSEARKTRQRHVLERNGLGTLVQFVKVVAPTASRQTHRHRVVGCEYGRNQPFPTRHTTKTRFCQPANLYWIAGVTGFSI